MGSTPPDFIPHSQGHLPAAAEAAPEGVSAASAELIGGAGDAGPVDAAPRKRQRPLWAVAPATYILVGINCGVFLGMVLQRISPWMPTVDQLMAWGADRPDNILIHGEWWRIVTAMF